MQRTSPRGHGQPGTRDGPAEHQRWIGHRTIQAAPDQKIIEGDRLKANVGLLASSTTQVQFTVKAGGQALPATLTVGPGQLQVLDELLDAFIGQDTIEITVTCSASAPPTSAPGQAAADQPRRRPRPSGETSGSRAR